VLAHEPHRPLPHFRWVPASVCHRSILSRIGASNIPGAIHNPQTGGLMLGAGCALLGGLACLGEAFLLALAGLFDLSEATSGVVLRSLLVLAGERLPLGGLGLPVSVGLVGLGSSVDGVSSSSVMK